MTIGEYITNAKNKLGYKSFADMARILDVPSAFLLRLSKVQNKDELKQENVENLERLANFLMISINDLINPKTIDKIDENYELNYLKDCDDVLIAIKELSQLTLKSDLKYDGYEMTNESKQILKDSLEVIKKLVKSKL
jgi:transcriptional regulator with XRE-family HTH domain